MPSLPKDHDSFQSIRNHGSQQVAYVRPSNARASRARNANIANILLRSPVAMKPRSESALVDRAFQNAAKHVRHATKPQSLPSLLSFPPQISLAETKGSTATFLLPSLAALVSPPEQVTQPSRFASRKSELASFLSESATTAASLATRSLSEPSLLSRDSDPDGSVHRESLEKFLSESAKVQAALDNESISEPSLLGLLAHVQEITGLLQRQTLGLKNKLGITGMSDHGEILMNSNSKFADLESNIEVVSEIEMLFESCAKILNVAIIKVGEQEVDNEAMDEYRKTFALETLFLNQLRKSFAEVGANLKGGSVMDSPKPKHLRFPAGVDDASVAEPNVSDPIRPLRRPSGGGADQPNMSKEEAAESDEVSFANEIEEEGASLKFDDSSISLVFEDKSNHRSAVGVENA